MPQHTAKAARGPISWPSARSRCGQAAFSWVRLSRPANRRMAAWSGASAGLRLTRWGGRRHCRMAWQHSAPPRSTRSRRRLSATSCDVGEPLLRDHHAHSSFFAPRIHQSWFQMVDACRLKAAERSRTASASPCRRGIRSVLVRPRPRNAAGRGPKVRA